MAKYKAIRIVRTDGSPPVYPDGWDPDNKHADIVLTGENQIAGWSGSEYVFGQVLAKNGKTSGKWYFEVEDVTDISANSVVGVQNGDESLSVYTGDTSDGWGFMANGRFYNSGIVYPDAGGWGSSGGTIMVAVDLDAGKIWFGLNGTWLPVSSSSPNPATGVDAHYSNLSGTIYPAYTPYHTHKTGIAHFTAAEQTYSAPTDFTAWNDQAPQTYEEHVEPGGVGFADYNIASLNDVEQDPFRFNENDKAAGITLTNDGKTAERASGPGIQGVRSLSTVNGGKWYFEVIIDTFTTGEITFGLMDSSHSLTLAVGNDASNVGFGNSPFNSRYYFDGTWNSLTQGMVAWNYYMFAADLDTGKIYMGVNGAWFSTAKPAHGTGAINTETELIGLDVFIAATIDGTVGNKISLRTKLADMEGQVPQGFYTFSDIQSEILVRWDIDNKSADIDVKDLGLTADWTGTNFVFGQVIADLGRSTGKFYFEVDAVVTAVGGVNSVVGVQNGSEDFDVYTGDTADGWGYMANGRFYNSSMVGATEGYWVNDAATIMVAVDLDTGKIWFGIDGVWDYESGSGDAPDPATGTDPVFSNLTGTIYPSYTPYHQLRHGRGKFSAADMSYAIPSGFLAWDGVQPVVGPQIYTPEIPAFGFGFADVLARQLTAEREAEASAFSLALSGIGHNFGLSESGLSLSDAWGRTRTINRFALTKINFTGSGGAANAVLLDAYAYSHFGLTDVHEYTISISPPAKGRIRFNEETGAAFAIVKAGGDADSHGVGITEETGTAIAASQTVGVVVGIGFGEETTRINDEFETGVLIRFGLSDEPGRHIEANGGVDTGLGLSVPSVGAEWTKNPPNVVATLSLGDVAGGLNYSAFVRENQGRLVYSYIAKITGGPDGLEDYEFPSLKSFQTRMRSGDPSYLSFVVPFNTDVLTAVNARTNGELIIEMAAGLFGEDPLQEELIRTTFESIRYDRGADSQSISLTGFKTISFGTGTASLSNVMTKTQDTDGTLRFRCSVLDFYLRPGFVASHDGDDFTVDTVSCIVGPSSQYMDVSE